MTKSPNIERVGIPFDENEARAYRGHGRVWRPDTWNDNGRSFVNYKNGRKKFRPKRKEIK